MTSRRRVKAQKGKCKLADFFFFAFFLFTFSFTASAQDMTADAKRLMERAEVKRAFDHIDAQKDRVLAEWIMLTEINAPSGKEHTRAEAVRKLLESCKLDGVSYDSKGNLIAI